MRLQKAKKKIKKGEIIIIYEQQAIRNYRKATVLTQTEFGHVFGYVSSGGWERGEANIPRSVLLAVGFYPPAYQKEADEAERLREAIKDASEEKMQKAAEKASIGIAESKRLIRKWCLVRGFVGRHGGIDLIAAAEALGVSDAAVRAYVYGYVSIPKFRSEVMRKEIEQDDG